MSNNCFCFLCAWRQLLGHVDTHMSAYSPMSTMMDEMKQRQKQFGVSAKVSTTPMFQFDLHYGQANSYPLHSKQQATADRQ
jgi:hypothetical protein